MSLKVFPEIPLTGYTSTDYDVEVSNSSNSENIGWYAFNRFTPNTMDSIVDSSYFRLDGDDVSLTLKSNSKNLIPKSLLWCGAISPYLIANPTESFKGGLYIFTLEGKASGSNTFDVIKNFTGVDLDGEAGGRDHDSDSNEQLLVKNGLVSACTAYTNSSNPQMVVYTSAANAANQTAPAVNNKALLELTLPETTTAYTEFRITGSGANGYFTDDNDARLYEIGILGWNEEEANAATTLWNEYQTRETRIHDEKDSVVNLNVTLTNYSQSASWQSMGTLVPTTYKQALDLKAVWDFHLTNVQAATATLTNTITADADYISSNNDPEYIYSADYVTMLENVNNYVTTSNVASNSITTLETEHASYLTRINNFVNYFKVKRYSKQPISTDISRMWKPSKDFNSPFNKVMLKKGSSDGSDYIKFKRLQQRVLDKKN